MIVILHETKLIGEKMNQIAGTYWKGCESMSPNPTGSARGLDVWWKPHEVVFQDWMAYDRILTGRFRYVGTQYFFSIGGLQASRYKGQEGFLEATTEGETNDRKCLMVGQRIF